jgi:ketosteroid isomerase-like protein
MALAPHQIQEIQDAFSRYAALYRNQDLKGFRTLLSPAMQGFGPGSDEVVKNRTDTIAAIRRDFSQVDAAAVSFSNLLINGDGRVAWAMGSCTFNVITGGKALSMETRLTAVLRDTGARWIFEQIHFSMPFTGQAPGRSFPE